MQPSNKLQLKVAAMTIIIYQMRVCASNLFNVYFSITREELCNPKVKFCLRKFDTFLLGFGINPTSGNMKLWF